MDIQTNKCYISRDIIFVEDQFPFHDLCQSTTSCLSTPMFPISPVHEFEDSHLPYVFISDTSPVTEHSHVSENLPVTETTLPIAVHKPTRVK